MGPKHLYLIAFAVTLGCAQAISRLRPRFGLEGGLSGVIEITTKK